MSITKHIKYPEVIREDDSRRKIDLSILKKKSSAKTVPGLILSYMKNFQKNGDLETAILFQELYKKVVALQTQEKIILKGWKGKSSLEIIEKPDLFVIVTFQKEDQDSKPHEVKREITKIEVNRIIKVINQLNIGKKISTRDIGELAYKRDWDKIFADRFLHTALHIIEPYFRANSILFRAEIYFRAKSLHTNLNLILRLLDYYNLTHYRGKYTTVLKKINKIEEILK